MDGFASCLRAELARLSGAEILLVTNLGLTGYPSLPTSSVIIPEDEEDEKMRRLRRRRPSLSGSNEVPRGPLWHSALD